VAGPARGSSVPISDEPFVVGRSESDAAGRLGGDPELSRRHAQVSLTEGGLLIEDLGSTNGTFVNGRRIPAATVVRPGDAIWVGTSTMIVTTPEQPIPAVAPAAPPTPSAESGLLGRFANLTDRHPKRILAATGVFFLIAAALGGPVAGLLEAEDPFVDSSAESVQATERIAAAKDELPDPQVIVLFEGRDVEAPATRRLVQRTASLVERDPLVTRAVSFYSTRGDPQFVSRDGTSTYAVVFFEDASDTEAHDAAERLIEPLEEIEGVKVGGSAVSGLQLGEQVGEDLGKAEALAFPILFALSIFVFRGVVAAMLPLFVGILTIFTTFLALRIVNGFVDLSEFALNVVIALGLGLAIDYSLFLVSRYREELAKVGEGRPASKVYGAIPRAEAGDQFVGTESEALKRTIYTAGRTILYSAATVAVALACLITFPQPFLYSMGIGGAICALAAVMVALVAVPAMLALLGPRINAGAPKRWKQAALRTARQERGGPWYRLSQAVMRRPATVAALSASFLILLGLPVLGIQFTGIDITAVPRDLSSRQVDETLRREFPPNPTSGSISVLVEAPRSEAARVGAFGEELRTRPGASDFAHEPEPLGDGLWEVVAVPEAPALDERSIELVEGIRAGPNPFPVTVAGDTATFIDQKETIRSNLPLALGLLCATTLVVLFLMTGSVVLPLKSLLMNFLSLSAAFGLLVLIFQEGNLEGVLGFESQGALELSQPVLLFAVAFGLATDYAVFLLTRIKEARTAGASDNDAVAFGLERTGRIVTQAALLFCVAIGAFATSSVIFIKEVGVGTALAVIIDATIIRALLVPSLMALLGARNWWAPGPLRRLHEKIGLSEG